MCACVQSQFSHIQLLATPRTVAHRAPLSMGFSKQEYRSGLPCPLPQDLSVPGIKPKSLKCPTLTGRFFLPLAQPEKPHIHYTIYKLDS